MYRLYFAKFEISYVYESNVYESLTPKKSFLILPPGTNGVRVRLRSHNKLNPLDSINSREMIFGKRVGK